MLRWLKTNAIPLMLIGAFFAGATINGWYRDAVAYREASAALEKLQRDVDRQGEIGAEWQVELRKLATNKKEVIREIKTIIERPVYRDICIDDDGVRLANKSKNGG